MLQELLASPEWQRVQTLWLSLQCFFDTPHEDPDWSLLRVWVDRELNVLQRLQLQKRLDAAQSQEVQGLFQQRFDQLLQLFYRQRQHPYGYQPAVPRGPFTRYQALADLERMFQSVQKRLKLPQVSQSIRDAVLHDLNFEVVERYTLQQPLALRQEIWNSALERVVWLSWHTPVLETWAEALPTSEAKTQALALRALKSSEWLSVQCCAIRVIDRTQNREIQAKYLLPLFQAEHTPEAIVLEILTGLIPDARWEKPLLDHLRRPASIACHQRVLKCWLALPEHAYREHLRQLLSLSEDQPPEFILSAWQALAHTSTHNRPCEELPEAFASVLPIFQHAVMEDHSALLQSALQTCTQLKDPRFVPAIQGALNGQHRQWSPLEKMGGGFQGERRSDNVLLLTALEQFGYRMYFDERLEKWSFD
jgi:hypothetical protein